MLINNFEHLLLGDEHHETTRAILQAFQDDLVTLGKTIDLKNKKRPFPCNSYNPRCMTSSVSI
jgi:hypothetical protein